MTVAVDVLRQFWLPGINAISGRVDGGLIYWLNSSKYQIYEPITATTFIVTATHPSAAVPAYAADVSRFATAAFESWYAITRNQRLPKSTGWVIIKAYYAAFFAGHSIQRMLGKSCTFLDQTTTGSVRSVADLFGMAPVATINAGLYRCTYDSRLGTLNCANLSPGKGGTHELFWRQFYELLGDLGTQILQHGAGLRGSRQAVAGKLDEVYSNLSDNGRVQGTWLSEVRNRVNYRLQFESWFPYGESDAYYDTLFAASLQWKRDPMTINLRLAGARELQRFLLTCAFILGLCRSLVQDMATRCPKGRSFHEYGAVSLLNLMS